MIAWAFFYLGKTWMTFVWFLIVETMTILYMRECSLLFFNLFIKNKNIIDWQAHGVMLAKEKQENGLSIVYPLNIFLQVQDDGSGVY